MIFPCNGFVSLFSSFSIIILPLDSAAGFLETTKLCEEDTNEIYSDAFYLASDYIKRELSMLFDVFF